MTKAKTYAAQNGRSPLVPFEIQRRDPGPNDVQIEILFCGVCHSDLHTVRNEWHNTTYPCVPGHEILGKVTKTGANVKRFKEEDIASVGCLVNSCRKCPECLAGNEQYCDQLIATYNSVDPHTGGMTYGGYSQRIVVDEAFVLRVPENLDPASAAPLLCAGITTYSPLRHWNVGKGMKVGVVGLGGLGHMAVKFANAFGAKVVLFTTSPNKRADAIRLGAHEVVISNNAIEMQMHLNSFDFILDTVSAQHDINVYLQLLKRDATLTLVGAPENPLPLAASSLISRRRRMAGSLIGGIPETQEMLDFCGSKGIACDIELIPIQKINEAYERMLRSDVKYRFVIDISSL
jgi:alcohol dehydrogenase (NADP+)